jgi:hypothetical protein
MPAGFTVDQCKGLADLPIPNGGEPPRFSRCNVLFQVGANRVNEKDVHQPVHDFIPSDSSSFELV